MNKYLLMSAAAVLSTSASAVYASTDKKAPTGSATLSLVTDNGTPLCSRDVLKWHGINYFAFMSNVMTNCVSSTAPGYGQGISGSTREVGKQVDVSDVYEGETGALNWTFSTPIRNGGVWTSWASNGSTTYETGHGHYYITDPNQPRTHKGPTIGRKALELKDNSEK